MGEATIYDKKDHLAILTLNGPYAMNAAIRREMGEAFVDFRDDGCIFISRNSLMAKRRFSRASFLSSG